MDPEELLAELVLEADVADKVDEVNSELERLVETPPAKRRRAQTHEFQEALDRWMRV
jgi:hypothetical protein